MSTESAARKAAERLFTVTIGGESYPVQIKVGVGKAPEKVFDLFQAACQTVAPPQIFKPYRGGGELEAIDAALKFVDECVSRRRCDAEAISECVRCTAVYLAKIVKQLKLPGAAPAVSTPPLNIGCDAHPNGPVEGCSGCAWINHVAAVSTPRCPKCSVADKLKLHPHSSIGPYIECKECEEEWTLENFSDVAQFFQPAPSPPRHDCKHEHWTTAVCADCGIGVSAALQSALNPPVAEPAPPAKAKP